MFVTENAPSRGEDPDERPRGRAVLHRDEAAADLPWLRRYRPAAGAVPVRVPARVFVPVHTTPSGIEVLRLFKDPLGSRVGVGFTSVARLQAVLGGGQEWTVMAEDCLRETLAGLGIGTVVRDPRMTAAPVAPVTPSAPEASAVRPAPAATDGTAPAHADRFDDTGEVDEADEADDVPRCLRHIPRNDRP